MQDYRRILKNRISKNNSTNDPRDITSQVTTEKIEVGYKQSVVE